MDSPYLYYIYLILITECLKCMHFKLILYYLIVGTKILSPGSINKCKYPNIKCRFISSGIGLFGSSVQQIKYNAFIHKFFHILHKNVAPP